MISRQSNPTLAGHRGAVQTSVFLHTVLIPGLLSVVCAVEVETTVPNNEEHKRSKDEILFMETILGSQAICTAPIRYTGLRRADQRAYK